MYKKPATLLAALVLIALSATYFAWNTADTDKTYENTVHGYALTYPATLDVREYGDENAVFGIIEPDMVEGSAEARILNVQGESGQSLSDAVAEQLKNLCAADGPTASFSCTGTISTEPFTTVGGEQGFVLILKGELKDLESGSSTEVPMGPYFTLTLASSATISKVLVIMPPINRSAAEADLEIIRTMAESVRVIR